MDFTETEILEGVARGDIRAISRLMSVSENAPEVSWKILPSLFARTGRAAVIGVTGAPGSGKSTLVDHLAVSFASQGKKVAILAIDPTSPFTGGAILGDRIRMNRTCENPEIFLRSMATRGSLGGLAATTFEAVHILDAAGFDVILIETVGVGQVEVDVVKMVDTCLVVLVPGMGDAVQTFKAGILEIADIFVINKSDRDGADLVEKDLKLLLSLGSYGDDSWRPPICRTVATKESGVPELVTSILNHKQWLGSSAEGVIKRKNAARDILLKLLSERLLAVVQNQYHSQIEGAIVAYAEKTKDPFSSVHELLGEFLEGRK